VNFFERQQAAKGTTIKLVVLFAAAVIALVAVIDGVVFGVMHSRQATTSSISGVLIAVTGITLLVIAAGMISKTISLRQGGAAVAASVGAVPVDPTTSDPQLRRFVNIVEEMSIASGVPTPKLFVLQSEPGINAFAAGFTPADAAITVTAGALQQLNRDELQGVIGHEFSHVLNGDMRLNIKLIGLLSGILLIGLIGLRVLQFGGGRGGDRDKNGAPILAIAVAMMVLGFVGVFFANLIKAAVSRQREWLADASAVQFTRQTTGLEGALKKIAGVPTGSALRDSRSAHEVSHMLFGEGGRSFAQLFATHPPLDARIKALDPSFRPEEIAELQERYARQTPNGLAEDASLGLVGAAPAAAPPAPSAPPAPVPRATITVTPQQVTERAGTLTPADLEHGAALSAEVPARLRRLASQPSTAADVILAMLVGPESPVRENQLKLIADRLGAGSAQDTATITADVTALPAAVRLPVVAIALPQLAGRHQRDQAALLATLNDLALADSSVTLFEYCVTRLVWSYLHDAADPVRRSRPGGTPLRRAAGPAVTLLATLAAAGTNDSAQARRAFDSAMSHLMPGVATPAHAPADTWRALDAGWPVLDSLDPSDKQRLVEAMVTTVLDDGTITVDEGELLRAACALMHVPLPALIA
jgi:Zn-dependent protease with chaperone function